MVAPLLLTTEPDEAPGGMAVPTKFVEAMVPVKLGSYPAIELHPPALRPPSPISGKLTCVDCEPIPPPVSVTKARLFVGPAVVQICADPPAGT